jgi:hypothetical protein
VVWGSVEDESFGSSNSIPTVVPIGCQLVLVLERVAVERKAGNKTREMDIPSKEMKPFCN